MIFESFQLERDYQRVLDATLTLALDLAISINRTRITTPSQLVKGSSDPNDCYWAAVWSFRFARELEWRRLEAELGLVFDHRLPPTPWSEQKTVSQLEAQIELLTSIIPHWIAEASEWNSANRTWKRDGKDQTAESSVYVGVRSVFGCAREIERKEKLCPTP